jgi:hypothetical protein
MTIASQTFTVSQAASSCAYSLSPTSQSIPLGGGNGTATVTAPAGCAWTAASNAVGWLIVNGPPNGSGTGSVSFTALANATSQPRTGTMTIAGQLFTVNQAGAACTYALSPTSQNVAGIGGTASTSLTTSTGCAWTASSNAAWLTLTSPANGTGNATVTFSAAANTTILQRTAVASVGGKTFTVTQAASTCSYAISPTSKSVVAAGGTGSTSVTTGAGCPWTASSTLNWITITGGDSGTGNGTVTFSVAPSTVSVQRTGAFTVAGKTFTVTQAANNCSYVLTPTNTTIAAGGGSGSFTVTTAAGCAWAATSNQTWVKPSGSGTGSGTVNFTVAANTGSTSRVGAIAIGTQVFTISQGAGTATQPTGLRVIGTESK